MQIYCLNKKYEKLFKLRELMKYFIQDKIKEFKIVFSTLYANAKLFIINFLNFMR